MRTVPRGRRVRRRHSDRASTLDARAVEVVARFVRILARCGCTPEDIGREVLKACRQVPKSWARNAMAAVRDMDAAAHVLTLWFSDPAYLDARGNPRPWPCEVRKARLRPWCCASIQSFKPLRSCVICSVQTY